MTQNDLKGYDSSQNIDQNIEALEQAEPNTTYDKSADKVEQIKAHYEAIIAKILAEKSSIEEQYKTSLIKEELRKLDINTELLYFVIKGRGDINKISYTNGTIEGLDDIISTYKQDEDIAHLFTSKSNKNDINEKMPRTRAIKSIGGSNFEKEKERICQDWCS